MKISDLIQGTFTTNEEAEMMKKIDMFDAASALTDLMTVAKDTVITIENNKI